MNAQRLLAHFDRVADAPDAVPRMRRFVLDLAVRGRLVEQDPVDEPASELLKRIAVARADAPRAKEWGSYSLEPEVIDRELFDLPTGWAWVSLGTVFLYDAGVKRKPNALNPSRWLLELGDIEKHTGRLIKKVRSAERASKSTKSEFQPGDILYGKLRPYLNKVLVADELGYSTTEIVAIRPYVPLCSEYCALALRRPDFVRYVTQLGQGTKMPRLRTNDANVAPFPLPPLAEQHRIVAKVDELMILCDRLEEVCVVREGIRDRLSSASFARFSASDADNVTFRSHARFAMSVLPAMTIRVDQVKCLRQTILNLAVRGKLVAQKPEDESASELLKRITEEKSRQNVRHSIEPLNRSEIPFSLPVGWLWSRIGGLCVKTGSGSTPRGGKNVYKRVGVPFLRSQNVYDDGLRLDHVACISPDVHARMAGTVVQSRDLLLNITGGSMGRCCRVPDNFDEANVSQHVAIIRPVVSEMADFLHKLVLSSYFQAIIFDEQTGAGRGGLPKYKLDRIAVAVPPLEEQRRIVAKIDVLMTQCDRLEASLDTAETGRHYLLESLLREVLDSSAIENNSADQMYLKSAPIMLRSQTTRKATNHRASNHHGLIWGA